MPAPMNSNATSACKATVTTRQTTAIAHCSQPSRPTFASREQVAGMKDQGDHGGAHAVEYSVHRLQIAEMDVEGAERRDDHEIREDKGPTSGPCAPESGTQV